MLTFETERALVARTAAELPIRDGRRRAPTSGRRRRSAEAGRDRRARAAGPRHAR